MPRQIRTVVMLSSLLKLTRFHLIPIQFRRTAYCQRKVVMTADKVYLRNDPSSQDLHINFRYANEELKIDRDFNFCRKMDEKLEGALNRIRGNIEKEFNKKLRKGKKKTSAQVQETLPESVTTNGEVCCVAVIAAVVVVVHDTNVISIHRYP